MAKAKQLFFSTSLVEKTPCHRQAILLQALPDIEKRYAKLQKSWRISSLKLNLAVADEALSFYNAVAADGRHIGTLIDDPEAVAGKLGIQSD